LEGGVPNFKEFFMKRDRLLYLVGFNAEVHPVVALLGPRQAGKTTLAHMYAEAHYPDDYHWFDLENPADVSRLDNPMLAIGQITKTLIVIDEIQRRPDIFPILRVMVDNPKNPYKFLILGSASRHLISQSSESLAGRIGYVDVLPFSIEETHEANKLWLRGGFPRSYLAVSGEKSAVWRQNYITTFLEQDIPNLGFQIPPQQLRRFWLMLAHYHGQIFNGSDIGRSLGVSHHTMKKYLDILIGTFMIRALEPWFENISKRQVKSAKLYFRDSGILHTLLTIDDESQLYSNPKVGAFWEGFALEEVIRCAETSPSECFFWATHSDAELDLFLMKFGKRLGFEFKYTDNPKITKSMHIALADLKLDHLYIIMPESDYYLLDEKIAVCGLNNIESVFKALKKSVS
jgi:Predicted ATPase (AAA+ superfamily)